MEKVSSIYLPKKNLFLSEKINEQTVLHLDLNDFIKIFNNVLFKNVMVITAEFFTDRTNYRSIMKVKKFVFKPNLPKPEVIEEEYELKSLDEIPITVRTFVDKTLNQYGVLRQSIIEEEKNRSNTLLLNILPEETALELKKNGKVQAKKFESVTVLFTDFEKFTYYADKLPPEKLVESIDFYFSKFDKSFSFY